MLRDEPVPAGAACWQVCHTGVPQTPTTFHVDAGLCDTVPACMESRLPSTSGTSLISAGNSFGSTGELCNATSTPLCNAATGCGWDFKETKSNTAPCSKLLTPKELLPA